jgi:NACHT domain-containing protein
MDRDDSRISGPSRHKRRQSRRARPLASASSPYSSGGGGVRFEHRVAANYLAKLLTGTSASELEGRCVRVVGFQQAPANATDDLVILGAREDESEPTVELQVAVRRAPLLVRSDEASEELVARLLSGIATVRVDGPSCLVAICVAGPTATAREVGLLADLAKSHGADSFFAALGTPRRFRRAVRERLKHLIALVTSAMARTGTVPSVEEPEHVTWQLLSRLHVLMPRLETPDETDWQELSNALSPWSRDHSPSAGAALRDRLESLAGTYAIAAAMVDDSLLRRGADDALDRSRSRRHRALVELRTLQQEAHEAVRTQIGLSPDEALQLPRKSEVESLRRRFREAQHLLIHGPSGAGKSALVMLERNRVAEECRDVEVVLLNLRHLPRTMAELRHSLGCALEDLLRDMSAPKRLLIIDGADYSAESDDAATLLGQLLRGAVSAEVGAWVVCSTEASTAVRTVVISALPNLVDHEISGLSDEDLDTVGEAFPHLRGVLGNSPSRELLRRPAVVDLLVRSASVERPVSDADVLEIVWKNLIRGHHSDHGAPDAREQVYRRLALQVLNKSSANQAFLALDPGALEGLRRDGLLQLPHASWQPLPDFSHELLRTYAVCKVLLADGNPVTALLEAGAPRWALPATRLAAQVLLSQPEPGQVRRLQVLQQEFDRIAKAGFGERWSDLPTEAVLPLASSRELLGEAWHDLLEQQGAGLQRVLRIIRQRHRKHGIVEFHVAQPVVALLLERPIGEGGELQRDAEKLTREWLGSLALARTPAGDDLRLKVRTAIADRVAREDLFMAEEVSAAAESAPPPQEVETRTVAPPAALWRRQRRPIELPPALMDTRVLETLALLASDLGEEGEGLLRRVAKDAPERLAPCLEEDFTDIAIVAYKPSLLTDLTEAYYLDSADDEFGMRHHDYGIRSHRPEASGPLAAFYKGPFIAMLRADFRRGVACLNKLLNHAARVRSAVLLEGRDSEIGGRLLSTTLQITGKPVAYIGDSHVWSWYRATGVGPYPCMSALQALEVVCDELIDAGVAPQQLVPVLLRGSENLAMPGLAVGLLIRNLGIAGEALDPFLVEPMVWRLEFDRYVADHSLFAASAGRVHAPERRKWTLREAAMMLTVRADESRVIALRALGHRLVERARQLTADDQRVFTNREMEYHPAEDLAAAQGWAATLDRSTYRSIEQPDGLLIQPTIPEDVRQTLEDGNRDLARGSEATRLLLRYADGILMPRRQPSLSSADIQADIDTARDLLAHPPQAAPAGPFGAPAAVAAAALQHHFSGRVVVALKDLRWCLELLLGITAAYAEQGESDFYESMDSFGPDRSAARGLAFALLPSAADDLRHGLEETAIIRDACQWLATHGSQEVRLLLAQACDEHWRAPCDSDGSTRCHHQEILRILEESARECLVGQWQPRLRRSQLDQVDGGLASGLDVAPADRIIVPRLSPAIRGLSTAATTLHCCTQAAGDLLEALLRAHRRGLIARDYRYQGSANDTLAAARSLLLMASQGNDDLFWKHLDDCAQHSGLLSSVLRALVAAAEERESLAMQARRLWPQLMSRVLDRWDAIEDDSVHDRRSALAELIPNPTPDGRYLWREIESEPIAWHNLLDWDDYVERWVSHVAGDAGCVDQLIGALRTLPIEVQAGRGISWIEALVSRDPAAVARRSWLLPGWLEKVRASLRGPDLVAWQRVVDSLVVANDPRVARLSD